MNLVESPLPGHNNRLENHNVQRRIRVRLITESRSAIGTFSAASETIYEIKRNGRFRFLGVEGMQSRMGRWRILMEVLMGEKPGIILNMPAFLKHLSIK